MLLSPPVQHKTAHRQCAWWISARPVVALPGWCIVLFCMFLFSLVWLVQCPDTATLHRAHSVQCTFCPAAVPWRLFCAEARVIFHGLHDCDAEMDDSWLTEWQHGVPGCILLKMWSHVVSNAVYMHYKFLRESIHVYQTFICSISCSDRSQCYLTMILAEQTVRLSYGLQQLQHSSMASGRLLSLGSPHVRAVL